MFAGGSDDCIALRREHVESKRLEFPEHCCIDRRNFLVQFEPNVDQQHARCYQHNYYQHDYNPYEFRCHFPLRIDRVIGFNFNNIVKFGIECS